MISPRVILFFFVFAILFIGVAWLLYWVMRAKTTKTGYNVYKKHEDMEYNVLDDMTPYPKGHHSFGEKIHDRMKSKPKPKKKNPEKNI